MRAHKLYKYLAIAIVLCTLPNSAHACFTLEDLNVLNSSKPKDLARIARWAVDEGNLKRFADGLGQGQNVDDAIMNLLGSTGGDVLGQIATLKMQITDDTTVIDLQSALNRLKAIIGSGTQPLSTFLITIRARINPNANTVNVAIDTVFTAIGDSRPASSPNLLASVQFQASRIHSNQLLAGAITAVQRLILGTTAQTTLHQNATEVLALMGNFMYLKSGALNLLAMISRTDTTLQAALNSVSALVGIGPTIPVLYDKVDTTRNEIDPSQVTLANAITSVKGELGGGGTVLARVQNVRAKLGVNQANLTTDAQAINMSIDPGSPTVQSALGSVDQILGDLAGGNTKDRVSQIRQTLFNALLNTQLGNANNIGTGNTAESFTIYQLLNILASRTNITGN